MKRPCAVSSGVMLLVFSAALAGQVAGGRAALPVWDWDFARVATAVNKVRAGRDLTPREWRGGARVAVALSFDLAAEISGGNTSVQELSCREYDTRAGLPRVLALLERYSIPVTFFVPAVTAQLHPEAIDAILRSSLRHEIAMYGWYQEPIIRLPAEDERRLTRKAFDYWTQRLGHRPAGIRTINWNYTDATLSIIRELGLSYDSGLMSDDRPYEILENGKPTGIVEVPVELLTDDWPYYGTGGSSSFFRIGDSEVLEILSHEFDWAYRERTLFQVTLHPFLMGHRSRVILLERLLAHIKSQPGVWFATHEQVAQAAAAQIGRQP